MESSRNSKKRVISKEDPKSETIHPPISNKDITNKANTKILGKARSIPKNAIELDQFFNSANSKITENQIISLDGFPVEKVSCKYFNCDDFNKSFSALKGFSLFHLNIGSLSKHFDDLTFLLQNLKHDFKIIGISETRIKTSTVQNFDIAGYSFLSNETESAAGGTALYIADYINHKQRNDLTSSIYLPKLLESTFVEISPKKQSNIVVGCIYKHPTLPISEFNKTFLAPLLDKINKEGKEIILLGDFNINLLNSHNAEVTEFVDILGSNLILPTISLPTRVTPHSQTLIDNILTSPSKFDIVSGNLTIGISDHLPQFLIFKTPSEDKTPYVKTYNEWKSFDSERFKIEFNNIDWKNKLSLEENNPSASFEKFYNNLNELINRHAPLKSTEIKVNHNKIKPWITNGIRKSIILRNKLYHRFINTKDQIMKNTFYQRYKIHRNEIVHLIRQSKINYYKTYFNENIRNVKNTWKGINELINHKKQHPSNISLNINEKLISDPKIISIKFNEFFTTIADKVREKIPATKKTFEHYIKKRTRNSFFFTPVTIEEITKIIKSLDSKKASGPYSIPSKILDTITTEISSILSDIFNLSFEIGKFIDPLKYVKVVPIFKNKGSPFEVSNFRPISLLSNVDKILEKLVHARLTSFLTHNKILFEKQFGFRSKHSTQHNLITLSEEIRKSLDKGEFSCGVFLDLRKAFDTVDHKILLKKMEYYGIRGIANNWFKSYLSGRLQSVFVSGMSSETLEIAHGVPQGSVLGPLLFLLYINDLPNAIIYSKPFIFADDTALLNSSKDLKSIKKKVNIDLKLLLNWLNANKIGLNVDKTEVVLFREQRKKINYDVRLKLNGKRLFFTEDVRYLGVQIDQHLTWDSYLKSLAKKLRRANGSISKLRHLLSRNVLISIYYALFHSHLSYALQIWGQALPSTSRVFKLQKSAVRLITFSNFDSHSKPLFDILKIPTIANLKFMLNIYLVHNTLNKLSPLAIQNILNLNHLPETHSTRAFIKKLLIRPGAKTIKFGISSINYQCVLDWNLLQNYYGLFDLASTSFFKIKQLTSSYLRNQ